MQVRAIAIRVNINKVTCCGMLYGLRSLLSACRPFAAGGLLSDITWPQLDEYTEKLSGPSMVDASG